MFRKKNYLAWCMLVTLASPTIFADNPTALQVVQKRIENAPNLSLLSLKMKFDHGTLYYEGNVNDKFAFADLLRIAYRTPGVEFVNIDTLHIKPQNSALKDTYITAKAETAVLKAKLLDDESIPLVGINAQTRNGVVTLSGVVPSNKAAIAIVKRITSIKGVKTVVSKLSVNP